MSAWISWAKAAPGVMVEVADELEAGVSGSQATVGRAAASKDERPGVTLRPAAARPARRRTDARRRPRSAA